MEELIGSVYAQAGALGLLAASGWGMYFLERKERIRIQLRRDELLEKLMTFMHDQKDVIDKLADGFALQKLIQEEFGKHRYERER